MEPSLLQLLLRGLAGAVPDNPDAITLAEALWLGPRLPVVARPVHPEALPPLHDPGDVASGGAVADAASSAVSEPHPPAESAPQASSVSPEPPPTPRAEQPAAPEEVPAAPLLPLAALPREVDAAALLPVWLEDPPLLADSLAFLRALLPLREQQLMGPRLRLDEEATVEAFVATCSPQGGGGCWRPVLVPIPEPRYDLVLVIDGSLTMVLWQRLVLDLQRALASCGVVRQLRLVRLASDGAVPPGQRRWCLPDPEGRRLLLLLSDCCGDDWWSGAMARRLMGWGDADSLAVLQVLPGWMWPRTALGLGDERVLRNAGTAAAVRLVAERQRWLSPLPPWALAPASTTGPCAVTLPVLRCEPEALAAWSGMLSAKPGQVCPGVALPTPEALAFAEAQALEEEEDSATASAEALAEAPPATTSEDSELAGLEEFQTLATPRARRLLQLLAAEAPPATTSEDSELAGLEEFQTLATPRARRLLQLLAAAPVLTLPVIRLVRQALLFGDRTPLATAEVLLGGVLQLREPAGANAHSISAADSWQFTMAPQVRQRLLSDIDAVDAITVFNAVTRLVEERWNQFMPRGSFRAFLTDPFQPLPPQLSGIEGFASVAAGVLETLGGDYAALARQLRDGAHRRVEEPWPADEFRFEEAEVETGALLPERIPPLQTLTVVVAEWQEIALQTLPFETTTLKLSSETESWLARFVSREGKLWSQRTQWRHPPQKGSGWCFREPLASAAEPPSASDLALTMVQIPAGRFPMGSPPKEVERLSAEGPHHEVSLASFFLSQTPITQAQWRAVAGWEAREGESWGSELNPNPSWFQSQGGKGEARLLEGEASTDERPVENVSWEEAMEFCARLSQRTGRTYTLPSEAQWEYACRAGTTTPFHFGETLTSELANYRASFTYANGPKGEYREQTTPVGMFPANAWGLQDMHGNVWEWCLDHWHDSYEGAPTDGSAWVEEEGLDGEQSRRTRLLRGGSWFGLPQVCRSAYRSRDFPGLRFDVRGFRVCCLPQD